MVALTRSEILCIGLALAMGDPTSAWVNHQQTTRHSRVISTQLPRGARSSPQPSTAEKSSSSSSLNALPAAAASLLAGSVAGALGVGVAYPLDTIKTKAQVLAVAPITEEMTLTTKTAATILEQKTTSSDDDDVPLIVNFDDEEDEPITTTTTTTVDVNAMTLLPGGTVAPATTTKVIPVPAAGASMMEVSDYIYQTSGIGGFFSGVQTSMVGQAIIKAVVFAVNAAVLQYSQSHHLFHDDKTLQLLTAAALAGFVTSFLAAPVDRIKVLMQCSDDECYNGNEKECFEAIIEKEGWKGFLGRGLGCTMLREIPAYSLYFGVYGGLQAYCGDISAALGPTLSAALYGAAAGCACWLPIYPIDVIRTVALNTEGADGDETSDSSTSTTTSKSTWQIAVELYKGAGVEAFYDGLGARLLRQAVNHAVTFSVYEVMMKVALFQQQPDIFA